MFFFVTGRRPKAKNLSFWDFLHGSGVKRGSVKEGSRRVLIKSVKRNRDGGFTSVISSVKLKKA